jgi:integrase
MSQSRYAGIATQNGTYMLALRLSRTLVFAQPGGRPWNPDHVSKRFQRLAAQAGVPVITLHEARHSAISLMHDAQVRDDIRMREAGPADVAVHQRYNHIQVGEHLAAAEQLAELVRKAGGES